uniref:Tetraspanin 16 n=1 Tax=Panthera leo TaxID=9689 RepID=A0A8C8X9K8_PANLE
TEMHTPYSSWKRLLSFFNGFTAISGVILIGRGIYGSFRGAVLTRVLALSSAYLLHVGSLCPAMSCLTGLLGFAGWSGATKGSRDTLLFCFLFMVIILIAEIPVVLAFFPIVQEVALEHVFATLRKNYNHSEPDDYSAEWNLVTGTGTFKLSSSLQ